MKTLILALLLVSGSAHANAVSGISCQEVNGPATAEYNQASNSLTVSNLNGQSSVYSIKSIDKGVLESVTFTAVNASGSYAQLRIEAGKSPALLQALAASAYMRCQAK